MAGSSAFSFILRCLFVLAYVEYFTCAFCNSLRYHRLSIVPSTKNINRQQAHLQLSTRPWTRFLADTSIVDTNETSKSAESTFWLAVPTTSTSSSNGTSKLPSIAGLDRETGLLPSGAYKTFGEGDIITSCLLAIGIRPRVCNDDGGQIWEEASKNCQKLIDSGFNTFLMNNPSADDLKSVTVRRKTTIQRGRTEKEMIALEKQSQQIRCLRTKIRHEAEDNFYKALHQNTPMSVLRSCHFIANIEVPAILSTQQQKYSGVDEEQNSVPFGNGWMVRESVGNALKRAKCETLGSVVLECKYSKDCCILQHYIHFL